MSAAARATSARRTRGWRGTAAAFLRAWAARRHGQDVLPLRVVRRRIYILPSRFGIALGLLVAAMLVAGLNYNSNLGLAFTFLMMGIALVAMHHCHRNLLGLAVDVNLIADAVAGGAARFEFILHNDTRVDRLDIEIRCGEDGEAIGSVAARGHRRVDVELSAPRRGVGSYSHVELRTRYPFGWFRAWTYVHRPLTAYVAPAPLGNRRMPSSGPSSGGGGAWSDARGDEDFAGLRSYQPGMPLKHMAWKVLARGRDPAVRSYAGSAAQPLWFQWQDLDGLDPEARLSQLARWILDGEASRHRYGLKLPGVEIAPGSGPAHRIACQRALAAFPAAEGRGAPPGVDAR